MKDEYKQLFQEIEEKKRRDKLTYCRGLPRT